jgi:hypothetical protein
MTWSKAWLQTSPIGDKGYDADHLCDRIVETGNAQSAAPGRASPPPSKDERSRP